MFTITINPTSPGELKEYLAVIKESGISCHPPALSIPSAPSLVERYKAATGKERAKLPGEALKAAGWNGEGQPSQEVKERAMTAEIEKAEGLPQGVTGESDHVQAVDVASVEWDDI